MPLACIFKSNLFIGLTNGKNIADVNVEEKFECTKYAMAPAAPQAASKAL